MKHLAALCLFVLSVNLSFAQTAPGLSQQASHRKLLSWLLQQHSAETPAMRTTSGISSERVIVQTTRDNTAGALNDSVNLKYGPNRGSTYDYNTLIYPYAYPYSASPMFNYAGSFTKPQVLFDTFRHWTIDPHTYVYGYYETDYAGYDINFNTTSYKELYADSSVNPNMTFSNRFNSARNIDSGYWFNFIAGATDSAFRQFFTYNTSGKIAKDSIYEYHRGAWHLASRSLYTYNATNDLIQIDNYSNNTDTSFTLPLVEQIQYINTYDASHRLLTVASSYYTGSAFGPYIIDTFGYSGTRTYHNAWKEYQYDPINHYWAPIFYMTKMANTAGLPDTVNIQGFDSLLNAWVPQTIYVVKYNTLNDPDTLQEYDYNFTAFPATPNYTTIYYYQPYLITAGTQPPVASTNTRIFPNPFSGQLTITGLDIASGNMVSASLINMSGQMVSRQAIMWQGQWQINTDRLLAGNYVLIIMDASGRQLHSCQVIKL